MSDDLLVRDYNALSLEEQAYAIDEAWILGGEYGRIYGATEGKPNPRFYVLYVVEDSYELGVCDEETYQYWQQASQEELSEDPRVQAFLQAWVQKKIMEEEE